MTLCNSANSHVLPTMTALERSLPILFFPTLHQAKHGAPCHSLKSLLLTTMKETKQTVPLMLSLRGLPRSRHIYQGPLRPTSQCTNHVNPICPRVLTTSKCLHPFHAGSLQAPQPQLRRILPSRKSPSMTASGTEHTSHTSHTLVGTAQPNHFICPPSPRPASGSTTNPTRLASTKTWPTCSTTSPRCSSA